MIAVCHKGVYIRLGKQASPTDCDSSIVAGEENIIVLHAIVDKVAILPLHADCGIISRAIIRDRIVCR